MSYPLTLTGSYGVVLDWSKSLFYCKYYVIVAVRILLTTTRTLRRSIHRNMYNKTKDGYCLLINIFICRTIHEKQY